MLKALSLKLSKNRLQNLRQTCFLWAALGSIGASATLKILGKEKTALFVGQWAAPFLLLGLYNKIVKLEGSDKKDKNQDSGFEFEEHPVSDYAEPEKGGEL
ncbi:hypothetical protein ACLI08_14815 [Flavobacterium sp. RNTU_13]|uniref:hypothetical protein n=1 Tax=Flavobacterium sp. RNTU_13 TaxID=3375145 RepID=UPI0039866BCA